METPEPPEQSVATATPRVAAVVLARSTGDLTPILSSIDAQVYEPVSVFVVSPEKPKPNVALPSARWAREVPDVVAEVQGTADYLWLVDPTAAPRTDALAALVETAGRVDASVAGSKLLSVTNEDELVSVGGTTDVFGFPFTGIEAGEVDQEQYDVIRDVAYVEPASMLVRRDLAAGLGGLDTKLPYLSAGLDFSQRARLAGGRVVVAPTSEVLVPAHSETTRAFTWREQAGRIRSMIKSYSVLTLLWALPGLAVIGAILSLYRTFNGAPLALLDWLRAWIWNIVHFPTTLVARRRARGNRQFGDEELFRYQIKGSVEVRAVASAVGALLQGEPEDEDDELIGLLDTSPGFWQQPAFLAAVFGGVFIAVFTRVIWSEAVPATGFALPLADSGWATLRAYAGGWHLGGLGSPDPMHPSVAATAIAQLPFGSRSVLAASVLTIGSVALGMAGTTRLARRLGRGHASRYLAGAMFVAGVPMLSIVGDGYWPALLAAAGLPWALAACVHPLGETRRVQIGRVARMTLALAWSAMMIPPLLVVPLLFAAAWSMANRTLRPLARAALATALATPLLLPWLSAQTISTLTTDGAPFHLDPTWWTLVPIGVAAATVVLFGKGGPARVAVVGTLLASLGLLASRASDLGAGRDLTAAGAVVAALGFALVLAGTFDVLNPLDSAGVIRRSAARVGVAGGVIAVILIAIALPAGRAGLPADDFASLEFAESRAGTHGSDRLLLIGPSDLMPGEFRRLADGTAYRIVGGFPSFPEAWLPESRAGDAALAETLESLGRGTELRPGEALAAFGVQWVVFTGDTPLVNVMTSQLDLRPLPQLVFQTFESDVDAYRAVTDQGVPWTWDAPDYLGPDWDTSVADGTVRIAENADPRWTPGWEQVDWANQLTTDTGVVGFSGVPIFRTWARVAALLALLLGAASIWGRAPRTGVTP